MTNDQSNINQAQIDNIENIAAELEQPRSTVEIKDVDSRAEQNVRVSRRLKKLQRKRGLTFSAGDPGGSGTFKKQRSAASAKLPAAHKPESCGAVKGMGERLGHLSEAAESVFENSDQDKLRDMRKKQAQEVHQQ